MFCCGHKKSPQSICGTLRLSYHNTIAFLKCYGTSFVLEDLIFKIIEHTIKIKKSATAFPVAQHISKML